MIQERRRAIHGATRAKRHVIRALCLQQEAESALRIGAAEHGNVAFAIDIAIIERRVLRLLRIFSQHAETTVRQVGTHVPCIDVLGQVQFVDGRCKNVVVFSILVLVDHRCSKRQVGVSLGHRLDPLIDIQFNVGAIDPRFVQVPIATLHATDTFQGQSMDGLPHDAATEQRVVDAQRTLFIGTQDETRSKLLVEVTQRQFGLALFGGTLQLHVDVRHTPALKILLESRQRMLQKLEAGTCVDILTLQAYVGIGIGQRPVTGVFGTNFLVVLRNKDVALDASRHHYLVVTLCIGGSYRQHGERSNPCCLSHKVTFSYSAATSSLTFSMSSSSAPSV